MFKEFEIWWDDLTAEAQQRLLDEGFVVDDNMKDYSIAVFVQEEVDND